MKSFKLLAIALMLLIGNHASAKVVEVHTSCGKTAHIDTSRTTMENTIRQIQAIDYALCG